MAGRVSQYGVFQFYMTAVWLKTSFSHNMYYSNNNIKLQF